MKSHDQQMSGLRQRRRMELFIAHEETNNTTTTAGPAMPPIPAFRPHHVPAPAPKQTHCTSQMCTWRQEYPMLLTMVGIMAVLAFCCCLVCCSARNQVEDRIKYRRVAEDVDDAFTDALDEEDDYEAYDNDVIEMNDLDGGNLSLEEVNG